MRILALDIGDVRVGVAVSDPDARVASPVCVLPTGEVKACARSFREVIEDWDPELIVCGLPKSLSGDEGAQAAHIREVASNIERDLQIPIEFTDERLSSREAKRILHDMGYDERKMRGKIDMIAASIFLQSYLDAKG